MVGVGGVGVTPSLLSLGLPAGLALLPGSLRQAFLEAPPPHGGSPCSLAALVMFQGGLSCQKEGKD